MERHIRQVHTKTKPYSCHHCSLAFSDYTTRHKHELAVHIKLRPFKCDQCSRTFSYSNVLKAHMKCHTYERLFKCAICSQNFTFKHNLEVHLKNIHLSKSDTFAKPLRNNEEVKSLGPLFIDTNLPHILPFDAAFLPQIIQMQMPQIHVINIPTFSILNSSQPLKVFIANI